MTISNRLFSPTSENLHGFYFLFVLNKFSLFTMQLFLNKSIKQKTN